MAEENREPGDDRGESTQKCFGCGSDQFTLDDKYGPLCSVCGRPVDSDWEDDGEPDQVAVRSAGAILVRCQLSEDFDHPDNAGKFQWPPVAVPNVRVGDLIQSLPLATGNDAEPLAMLIGEVVSRLHVYFDAGPGLVLILRSRPEFSIGVDR